MRLLSWNVNGFRSVLKKGFLDWLVEDQPDVLCLQETRVREDQLAPEVFEAITEAGYKMFWNPAEKAGYSGTATFIKSEPDWIGKGLGDLDPDLLHWDTEGRVSLTRINGFLLFNIYFPNGTSSDERLKYKMDFYRDFDLLCKKLQAKGEKLIICGDLNTSHKDIDLARPGPNRKNSGFLPEECAWIDDFLLGDENGSIIDSFRWLNPETAEAYSWWSFRGGARSRNVGWRLDYFFISESLLPRLQSAAIRTEVMGSDHCPVELVLK
jgi:exodeoxyribonuclease III